MFTSENLNYSIDSIIFRRPVELRTLLPTPHNTFSLQDLKERIASIEHRPAHPLGAVDVQARVAAVRHAFLHAHVEPAHDAL